MTRLALLSLVLVGAAGAAELRLDGPEGHKLLRTRFGLYGYHPAHCVGLEPDGLRLRLPAGKGVSQTGVYSLFNLSGDCEVSLTYELLNLPAAKEGYGSGVGLAFDAGDEVGRGILQRVDKPKEGGGHVLQSGLVGAEKKLNEEYRFVKTSAKRGWLSLRREKAELVFLAADDLAAEMKEIGRLPFTDRTVRAVRLFADPGGSSTAIDARLRQITARADEITGGVPKAERRSWRWWWALTPLGAVGAAALAWWWRNRR